MTYFDREASNYISRSQKGVWKHFRQTELQAVLKELEPKPGEKILDVGCGPGFYSRELKRFGAEVVGIDCSVEMIEQFRSTGLHGVHGDFESYNFDSRFNKVLIAGAAEFMSNSSSIIKQIETVLLPQGRAVILVPRNNFFGQIYKTWHWSHGCNVFLHDYRSAFKNNSELKITSIQNVTPMSALLRIERL
jgi:2-polyprenyl-3-methyl-5-hydroxy-6-metoxy-1,4-benzoquinol methylase